MRAFSTFSRVAFKKELVTQFIKTIKPQNVATTGANPASRWKPTNGDSFRSFAEYRLKVTNQSPLAVASKKQ